MATAVLPVPSELRIEGGSLISRSLQPGDRAIPAPPDLLLRFGGITTSEDVLTFARQYGLLQLHRQNATRRWEEPLAYWFQVARQVRAILNIATAMHQGGGGSIEDWDVVFEGVEDQRALPFLVERRAPPPEAAQFLLSMLLNEWLTTFDVRPHLYWVDATPAIVFSRTLRAALALDLVIAVTRTKRLVVCSACGQPYFRQRRQPKRGQQNYCSRCRQDGAPARHASTQYRMRIASGLRPARRPHRRHSTKR
jgi:hypothetical protein